MVVVVATGKVRMIRRTGEGLEALVALLVALLMALATPADAATRPADLSVLPSSLQLTGRGCRHAVLATSVAADGATTDVTGEAKFASRNPSIVRVDPDGSLEALADGATEVVVSYGGRSRAVAVSVVGTANTKPPSFRQDVVPVFTRVGCNAGSCHGKLVGQNGFKLSLRGYAPEIDFEALTNDLSARRIDFASPADSLLIAKPLGKVPHEGGRRINEDSRAYQLLLDWVKARAPGPDASEADAASLELLPGDRTLKIGQTQRLLALARYPDGRVRDVTWLAQFVSNDASTVSVTPDGVVKALRHGAAAVRAHFQNQVAVLTFTIPFDNKVDPSLFAKKNNLIDEHVFARLAALHLPPSPGCDDASFCRRVFIDTIGTLPTAQEIREFLADSRADKRERLVDALLNREEYVDYWSQQLGDLFQNRKERDHDVRGTKGVRSFGWWIRQQVAQNRPWDQIARDLLTARGDAAHEPQIGYYLYTIGEKTPDQSDVGDSVAQALLGTRIGCARCHNHPLERYTQDDYYHFVAFFSRVKLERKEVGQGVCGLKTDDNKEPIGVTQPRTGQRMAPQPLDRSPVDCKSGQDPRDALAAWVTDPSNAYFSGAMVNRLWKHFMGVGLVEPVDDLRSSNPPSNPPLWEALNREFVSHHYDLKYLMRLILASRAYQLSAVTLPQNEQDAKFYSHYYARRLPAEVMADAVSDATGVPDTFAGYPLGTRAVELPDPGIESYFLTTFGRSERVTACACERSEQVSLPQLLYLSNGDELQRKIRSPEGRLATLLKSDLSPEQMTEELFLATISRPATDQQKAAVTAALASGDKREEVFHDLLWALLNSKEFAFNH